MLLNRWESWYHMHNLMQIFRPLFALALCVFTFQAIADGFPESYIQKGLLEARQGIPIDVTSLKPGERLVTEYVGRPVSVYRRTASDIDAIEAAQEITLADSRGKNLRASIRSEYGSSSSAVWARLLLLSQPIEKKYPFRSIDKGLLVVAGWGPGSGCALQFIDPSDRKTSSAIFRDPCSGAQFDASGRVFRSSMAGSPGTQPTSFNLAIPPYRIEGGRLTIGLAKDQGIPELSFTRGDLYPENEPTKLLISAARYNDIDTLRVALKMGAKADYFKPGEGSPIDAAAVGSSMEIIKLLVANGAKQTPNTINAASFVGRKDLIDYLKSVPK